MSATRRWYQFAAASRLSIRISKRLLRDSWRRSGSFTSAPMPCSCARKCASGWLLNTGKRILDSGRIWKRKSRLYNRRVWFRKKTRLRFAKVRRILRNRPSRQVNGCTGTCIKMVKLLGYQVATNTTVYKETDMQEIERMFDYISDLGVDGHTITPGYDYDAAKRDMTKRLNLLPENFFLTRAMTIQKFRKVEEWMKRYTFLGTPVYFEFLAGKRDLTCSAWAIPTRNIRGWKGPCYLMTDGHYSSYAELLEKTEWDRYGVVNGIARDSRCENCMVHCGYEPTATLGLQAQPGDTWKTIKFNFGAKPKPAGRGSETLAFNGVSSGNGHLTGKRAEVAAAQAS